MEAEIERLHHSVDHLSGALTDLKADIARQADKVEDVGNRQSAGFRDLLDRLHETYRDLLQKQGETFKDLVARQDGTFKAFGDRLNEIVVTQHSSATALRQDLRTDFARIVDRQDSHFRWLVGTVLSVALALAALLYRSLHH